MWDRKRDRREKDDKRVTEGEGEKGERQKEMERRVWIQRER